MVARTTPRLADLEPGRLAADVVEQLRRHVSDAVFHLAPAYWIHWTESGDGAAGTDLGSTIRDLCAWAQRGEGRADEALDAVSTVAGILYRRAMDGADYEIAELSGDAGPTTEIGLLLVASLARCRLVSDETLTARDLAALASLSEPQIRSLIRSRRIKATGGGAHARRITAAEARRWLASLP